MGSPRGASGAELLADVVLRRRHELFVGRASERAAFLGLLEASQPGVLFIHAQGGFGKTALLHELLYLCREMGVAALRLDGGQIDPTPSSLLLTLAQLAESSLDSLADLHSLRARVLLIDTFESLAPMESWFRESFLPALPAETLVVLAGREPPSSAWRGDAGWHLLLRTLALEELSPDECRDYLTRRGVPESRQRAVHSFTHGHALALSLVADLFAQTPFTEFSAEEAPDVVRALVAQLSRSLPDPVQRAALEACAVAHTTTEPLLATLLDVPDVHAPFEWLRALSFMQSDRAGIFPHELVRKVLVADLMIRDPDRLRGLRKRALRYQVSRCTSASSAEWRSSAVECMYHIFQMLPKQLRLLLPEGARHLRPEVATARDLPALMAMVERHEGRESAAIASHWFNRQLHNVTVIRDAADEPAGILAIVALHGLDGDDRQIDPAVARVLDYLGDGRLPAGRTATFSRFWMARDTYQDPSPVELLCGSLVNQNHLVTPQLGYSFMSFSDPDRFAQVATLGGYVRTPDLDFDVGGRRYGVYAQDWRETTPVKFLAQLVQTGQPSSSEPPTAFDAESFAHGVRMALRQLNEPHLLVDNPLLDARVVMARVPADAHPSLRMDALRALVSETIQLLEGAPRSRKLHAALRATFVDPIGTQEETSEALGLPFSTYRRHLSEGVAAVIDLLWRQESVR
jgi:hypothetical protein